MARHIAPHPVTLSAIERLTPTQAERMRRRALHALRTARGAERERWSQALLLSDARLGQEAEPAFEDRLALAKVALGRSASNENERVKREAAAVRQSMTGSATQPDVASKARATRASMEKARPVARSSPSGSFEQRLAAAKAALGR